MNRLVYVAHPLRENPLLNIARMLDISREIFAGGDIPICPPLMFPWLEDSDADDRALGMEAGLHLLALCREVRVYGARGTYSEGRDREVLRAHELGLPVRWMDETGEDAA